MFRFILSLVLVANIVACPLRCTFCQAGGLPVEVCLEDVCPCCHPQPADEPTQPDQDKRPGEDCQCPNCICAGATLSDSPKLPVGDEPLVEMLMFNMANCKIDDACGCTVGVSFSIRTLCLNAGRELRLAHQSWTI